MGNKQKHVLNINSAFWKDLTYIDVPCVCVVISCNPRGGYSLWWPIRTGSARKGYLFQASGIRKDRGFTSWNISKGRETCHLGLWNPKDPKSLQQLKGCKVLNKICEIKGVPFVNRRYTKGGPFSWKMGHKRVRGWTSGRSLSVQTDICWVPPELVIWVSKVVFLKRVSGIHHSVHSYMLKWQSLLIMIIYCDWRLCSILIPTYCSTY